MIFAIIFMLALCLFVILFCGTIFIAVTSAVLKAMAIVAAITIIAYVLWFVWMLIF